MAIFGFGKKEENKGCGCGGGCGNNESSFKQTDDNSSVKVLGSGCTKCNELEKNAVAALKQLSMDTTVRHVTDFGEIATYGVMSTPALVFGNNVVSYGKVLKVDEIVELLQKMKR